MLILFILLLLSFFNFEIHIFAADYIDRKQPLGGLLFLLSKSGVSSETKEDDKLMQLERLLVHSNIPVSILFVNLSSTLPQSLIPNP